MEHKPLKEYWSKRDFKITSEPKGKVLAKEMDRFVVQEHWASHHHFDFRLEMDGVLKSWAVPKGIPYKKGLKRLAVQTEDHPISYIDFEGEIPEGQYGAGVVKIFDKGKYKLIRRNEKNLVFKLEGERIRGEYSLLKFKEPNQWLIFKLN
ncbi:3'-phosphoesterase [bacterium]|nr:3'-phosphoesterase [bacterium]